MEDVPDPQASADQEIKRQWGCRHPVFAVAMAIVIGALIWVLFL